MGASAAPVAGGGMGLSPTSSIHTPASGGGGEVSSGIEPANVHSPNMPLASSDQAAMMSPGGGSEYCQKDDGEFQFVRKLCVEDCTK